LRPKSSNSDGFSSLLRKKTRWESQLGVKQAESGIQVFKKNKIPQGLGDETASSRTASGESLA
jgi:hypothetical protein